MIPLAREAACLVLLAMVPASIAGVWHPRRPADAPAIVQGEVTAATASTWRDALWIDVRPADRYAAGHVPGALRLDEDAWEDGLAELAAHWDGVRPIVVYCDGGGCEASRAVADRLRRELAAERVFAMQGGWTAWSSSPR
ncbi:MAG TPA: rhodanese-like domain-containing protein [Planctomycetota bacterium]|nr:rhodanese-like domain-containing protein [Planctomycetota bacterium]